MDYLYAAVIRPSDGGGYWAEVPDLPGCFGQGETFLDTLRSIADGMETHLAALEESGHEIPAAHEISIAESNVDHEVSSASDTATDARIVYLRVDTARIALGVPSVSASEAARRLGVSPGRVSQLIASGQLVGRRYATGTLVSLESIEAYRQGNHPVGRPKKTALAN